MTLLEYIKRYSEECIVIHDKEYEMKFEICDDDPELDDCERAIKKIAGLLDIEKIESVTSVTVNFSDVIRRNLKALKEADLFYVTKVDNIMKDMQNILLFMDDEDWMTEFADVLEKGERERKS